MAPPQAHLFPRPRHVELHGDGPPAAVAAHPIEQVDAGLPAEGFVLELSADRVLVRHADDRGLIYARRTLGQFVEQFTNANANAGEERLPGLTIRDWPDFPVRGYMLDISAVTMVILQPY
jgi:N-acetyl-beta-hexosaminidase